MTVPLLILVFGLVAVALALILAYVLGHIPAQAAIDSPLLYKAAQGIGACLLLLGFLLIAAALLGMLGDWIGVAL